MPLDIAINVNDRRIRYAPGAGTLTMDFDFPIFEKSHLRVTRVRGAVVSTLALDVDYTIPDADVDTEDGGTITLIPSASLAGDVYILDGNIPNERLSDYQQLGVIPARQLNDDLDLIWMRAQEMTTRLDRSIAFKNTFNGTPGEIDDVAIAAGAMIRRNAANTGWEFFTSFGSVGAVTLPLSIANGGTGQDTAPLAWDAIKQMADQATVNAGSDDSKAFSPLKLWTAPMRGGWKNIFGANGGAEVWQRGTSIAVAASSVVYTLDRVYLVTNANQASTVSQQPGLVDGSRFSARVQRNAGQTGIGEMVQGFPLDTDEVVSLRGRKISMRLALRAGANWSPASGALTISLHVGPGVASKRPIGGYASETQIFTTTVNLTPGGAVVVATVVSAGTVPNNATQADLVFRWTPVGTAGAADYFEWDDLDGRRDEPVIDQFERRPFEDELRACMRHFYKTFEYDVAPAQNTGLLNGALIYSVNRAGVASNTMYLKHPVPMRVAPTMTTYNPQAANANWRNTSLPADSGGNATFYQTRDACGISNPQVAGDALGNTIRMHAAWDAGI